MAIKNVFIGAKLDQDTLDLIDRAAVKDMRSRAQFVVVAAKQKAEEILAAP